MKNLAGKSAVLGDVLSRSPAGAEEATLAPLRRVRDFSLGDVLGAEEAEGLHADGAGTNAAGCVLFVVPALPAEPAGGGAVAAEALQESSYWSREYGLLEREEKKHVPSLSW